jgi:hypothetical protein
MNWRARIQGGAQAHQNEAAKLHGENPIRKTAVARGFARNTRTGNHLLIYNRLAGRTSSGALHLARQIIVIKFICDNCVQTTTVAGSGRSRPLK